MDQILSIRETIVKFIKRWENILVPVLKFIFALIIFNYISRIGYVSESFVKYTKAPYAFPYAAMFCVLFTVFPMPVGYMLIIAAIVLQLTSVIEIAAVVAIFLLLVMLFYIRLAPKRCALILAMLFGFYFNVPYIVPLFAGLYMGITSIVPIAIGIFIWESFIPLILRLLSNFKSAELNLMDLPASFMELYVTITSYVKANNYWIFWVFIFAMVIVLVYAISRLSMDYAKELAIGLGAVLNVLSFIMIAIITDIQINVFFMFIQTVLAAMIVYIIRFFDCLLDYSRAESVQFEDEDNYYYVKVIPKISLTKKKRVVKRIRPENE